MEDLINKESSMLCDVQYVRKTKETPDLLYEVWKDLDTMEKRLRITKEPQIDIYFEKEEYRTHTYNKTYELLEHLTPHRVKYNNLHNEIVNEIGKSAKEFMQNAYSTRSAEKISEARKALLLYPYVFGADYDPVSLTRVDWVMNRNNDRRKVLTKGFLDIEVDSYNVTRMPTPEDCPVNAVTLIDDYHNKSYTFLLINQGYKFNELLSSEENAKRAADYKKMNEDQQWMMDNTDEFISKLHTLFDKEYGYIDYNIYFYSDERKMLVHLFQLINSLKLDFIGIWNISFDIPYLMDRMKILGLDPMTVMSHPDFPVMKCYFKEDKKNHNIKNKLDYFYLTSYTVFYDQMELYASIRKGASELRSYRLNAISDIELGDKKVDFKDGVGVELHRPMEENEKVDIKNIAQKNFELFTIYNIKDVLLQKGIERKTSDFDTLYVYSFNNATPYDSVFKQTVKLRNVQYISFLEQGLIPGSNMNIFNDKEAEEYEKILNDDDDDDEENFEGALVADPTFNDYVGVSIYGKPSNNIFRFAIDMDMSAFYPSTIRAMNIDASTLIFKLILEASEFEPWGGKVPFRSITKDGIFNATDDIAKECIDNFQTGNLISTAAKWMNFPSVDEVYEMCKKKIG